MRKGPGSDRIDTYTITTRACLPKARSWPRRNHYPERDKAASPSSCRLFPPT